MRESIALLEPSRVENLNSQARMAPEALDGHFSEERHRLYRMLRLKVLISPDRSLRVNGLLVTGPVQSGFMEPEMVPR